ncbi:MAG: HEAT repeat domain-containing protein [Elusimicrobiota bacterium]
MKTFIAHARDHRAAALVFALLAALIAAPLLAFGAPASAGTKPKLTDADKRLLACREIGERADDADAGAVLLAFRTEKVAIIRQCLAETATKLGSAGRPVLLAAIRDKDAGVRQSAAIGLSLLGTEADTPVLITLFKREKDVGVRARIANLLYLLKAAGSEDLEAVARDSDPRVRKLAVRALGRSKHPQAGRLLKEAASDGDAKVRGEAKKVQAEKEKARKKGKKGRN